MKLTGKCKEEFEEWFENKYDNNNTSKVIMLQSEFYIMPFEFQYGVYVYYFWNCCKIPVEHDLMFMKMYKNALIKYMIDEVEKADKIRNVQLTTK